MNQPEPSNHASPPREAEANARTSPLDWARSAGCVEVVADSIARHVRRRRRRMIVATGAALAVVLGLGITLRTARQRDRLPLAATHTVVVSEPARQTLADGSIVELRGDAAIRVDFSGGVRRVTLLHGAAHFQVAKDAVHPFVVESAGVGVRAVGTAFMVQQGEHEVEVVVTEGKVAVAEAVRFASPAAPAPDTPLVKAGERTVIDLSALAATAKASPVSAEEIHARLAWRVPKLEFNGTALAEVLELFNRQSAGRENVHLVLGDPELGNLPLSGALRADNVGVLLKILETSYGISATSVNDQIVLRRSH